MFTVINNITEVTQRLGSDLTLGETVELNGHHYLAVTDGGVLRLLDLDTKTLGEVVPGAAYTPIAVVATLANA